LHAADTSTAVAQLPTLRLSCEARHTRQVAFPFIPAEDRTMNAIRLHARHPIPPFNHPTAAFEALDAATRDARVASFAVSPCGAEESTVLAVWLNAALNDAGAEADRTELLRGCPDFFAGDGGRALVAWLHQSAGSQLREARG